MRQIATAWTALPLLVGLALGGASCNSEGGAKSPRLSTIPSQTVAGGTALSVDLATYVSDDSATATYAVVSGGGSFSGSTYSHTFPTLGLYTVSFKVTDFRGKSATGSFTVRVKNAQLAVVKSGTGLSLYDTATDNLTLVATDDGNARTHEVALADGTMVFEQTSAGKTDVWLFDPNSGETVPVATDSEKNETYAAKTSTDKVVFVRGDSPNRALHLFDPLNENTVQITAAASGELRDERDALVNSSDLVFFESALNNLADIHYYDVALAKTVAVSTDAKDEDLLTVLADGAVVFRRKGESGEWDLFYFRTGVGVVEIGADLGVSFAESKTYKGKTSESRVVFETTTGTDIDLYVWNPADGQSTLIAGGADSTNQTFLAVSGSGRIVYKIATSGTNGDISLFNPALGTSVVVANSANDEVYNGTMSNGDLVYTRDTGKDLYVYDESVPSSTVFPGAGGTSTDYIFAKVLANDDTVYTVGTSLYMLPFGGGTATDIVTAAGTETFAGETTGGDFVVSLLTGAQTDLYLWDKSGTSVVTVTALAGNDTYQNVSSGGNILFANLATGASATELWVFKPGAATRTKLTTSAGSDTVLAVYSASFVD